MPRVIRGRLVTPTTVELDEPFEGAADPVEVTLRLTSSGCVGKSKTQGLFWAERTLEDLAAEQGVTLPQDLDSLIGAGADLWDDGQEFDAFLREMDAARHPERLGGQA